MFGKLTELAKTTGQREGQFLNNFFYWVKVTEVFYSTDKELYQLMKNFVRQYQIKEGE